MKKIPIAKDQFQTFFTDALEARKKYKTMVLENALDFAKKICQSTDKKIMVAPDKLFGDVYFIFKSSEWKARGKDTAELVNLLEELHSFCKIELDQEISWLFLSNKEFEKYEKEAE